ncbi:inactive hydroxysteroid dehydrogenase-like protein 1 [Penaeus japonicus]|uniref:inactive hydroxysteroid dehydrogenase-like protein 1 n=1 Tax=Penaeus japonicus TaxID=27405 RepID=UPI001C7165FD|nr:inactive hydroxysteroid dehydrogenase-like protein 1 [Penaeus japonicus]
MLDLEEPLPFPLPKAAQNVLTVVGFLVVGKILVCAVWAAVAMLRTHLWARLWDKRLPQTYGKWAVVTGSTDGIGKSYAKELAKKGMNILLVSRNMEKLQRVAGEIRSQYGVETDIAQADFADGRPIYSNIEKHLTDKDIGILVNNVGMAVHPRLYERQMEDDIWAYVNVNVASVLAMTRLVLPGMLRRKKGAIVNVSSITAHFPMAYIEVYSATKAFVSSFTRALQLEYGSSGVTIQCLEPAFVISNMTSSVEEFRTPGLFLPTSDTFAANAVATIGYSNRTTGYWTHELQLAWWKSFPEWYIMNGFKGFFESKQKIE